MAKGERRTAETDGVLLSLRVFLRTTLKIKGGVNLELWSGRRIDPLPLDALAIFRVFSTTPVSNITPGKPARRCFRILQELPAVTESSCIFKYFRVCLTTLAGGRLP